MDQDVSPAKDLAGTDLVRRMGHDFNNLFSIMLGGLSLLREEIPETQWTQDSRETYQDLVSATREAADVVARLTAWAGRQALEPENLDIGEATQEAAQRCRERLAPGVQIKVESDSDNVIAWADRIHLLQAIDELVDNARDAIGSKGEICLGVHGGESPGVYVMDSGIGMSTDVTNTCREPYVTTRNDLGRRGLGLSVVDGFARASGGTLKIESEEHRGTRATILLPTRDPRSS